MPNVAFCKYIIKEYKNRSFFNLTDPKDSNIQNASDLEHNSKRKLHKINDNNSQNGIDIESLIPSPFRKDKNINLYKNKLTWISNNKQNSTQLILIIFHLCRYTNLHINYVTYKHYRKTKEDYVEVFYVQLGEFDY